MEALSQHEIDAQFAAMTAGLEVQTHAAENPVAFPEAEIDAQVANFAAELDSLDSALSVDDHAFLAENRMTWRGLNTEEQASYDRAQRRLEAFGQFALQQMNAPHPFESQNDDETRR